MMDKENLIKQAREAIASKDFDRAIEICNALMQAFPNDQEISILYEEAQNALILSQQDEAKDTSSGYLEFEFESFGKESQKDEFSEKYPDIAEAFQTRDFSAVISLCQQYLGTDPNNHELQQKLQKAIELQEAEPFLQSFISTGQTLLESGLYIDAIKQFEKVKIIDPNYPGIEDLITQAKAAIHGDSFATSTSYETATTAAQTETLTPTQEKVQLLIQEGQSYFNSRQYQKAIDTWSEIFMYDITNKEAQELIERARNEMVIIKGQIQKYLEEAKKFISEENYEQAEKLLNNASELESENAEVQELLTVVSSKRKPLIDVDILPKADAAFHAKDYKLAYELYQQIIAVQPDNEIVKEKVNECKMLMQKQEQINKLISDAHVFHMQGKKDSAVFALKKVLEIDPSNKEAEMFLNTLQSATAAVGVAPAKEAKSPLLKIIIPLLLIIIAGVYFFFFREKETTVVQAPPVSPQKPLTTSKPKPKPIVNPKPVAPPPKPLTPAEEKKILDLLDEAHNLQIADNLEKALEKYNEILAIKPDHQDAFAKTEEIKRRLEAIESSKKNFLSETEKYYNMQDFEAVVRVLKVALDKFPNNHIFLSLIKDAYFNLGIASLKKFQCDAAVEYLKQLEFLDPSDKSAQNEIKIAYSCKGKTSIEPSLKYEIDAIQLRPFNIPEELTTKSETEK